VMLNRLRTYLSFIRFSHSVFALPFALAGALLAARHAAVTWSHVGWILVAMVTARSAAMGFNRLVDRRFDALNPRTANREIPRGAMSAAEATAFVVIASALFVFAASRLNWLCFLLSVAPVGGWLAVGGGAGLEPWLLAVAIGAWVGGFDVLYACQDIDFDRAHGLQSIPARYGIPAALAISRALHVVTIVCLLALAWVTPLSMFYFAGVGLVALLLIYEQSLVAADDLSQVKRAFDLNGYVGILYLLVLAVAIYVR
jgi:4-hydroxybenzoate polyprenyltransferase